MHSLRTNQNTTVTPGQVTSGNKKKIYNAFFNKGIRFMSKITHQIRLRA